MIGVALGLLALLATAGRLQPDVNGFGTHQQLGLPACTAVELFGFRCPSCGMTTSWAFLVRGDIPAALSANSGGTLLGITVIIVCPWLLGSAGVGRWIAVRPSSQKVVILAVVLVMVTIVDWIWRLSHG
jgi:hypothetical protein